MNENKLTEKLKFERINEQMKNIISKGVTGCETKNLRM